MPLKTSSKEVKCNTKIKEYRDGSYTITRSDRHIFKDPAFEYHCKHEHSIDERSRQEQLKKARENYICYFEYEDENGNIMLDMLDTRKFKDKQSQSGEVRSDSVQRAKQSIFDIVYQNDWKYFLTITFNGDNLDRTNPKEVIKPLKKWLENAVSRKGLKYILVPEYHKKGGIHCHALINDCDFKFVDSGTRLVKGHDKPLKIDTIKCLHICDKLGCDISDLPVVYNVSDWRYGFSTAIQTYGQMSNLAFYVTKYITKDVKKIFGKFFWSSKNIVRKTKEIYCNSDFKDDLPIVSPPRANVCFQYESSFTFSSQVEKNCNDILQYLKENGNDDVL